MKYILKHNKKYDYGLWEDRGGGGVKFESKLVEDLKIS